MVFAPVPSENQFRRFIWKSLRKHVDELVMTGKGNHSGHGRLMKEWIVKRRRGWTREASLPAREG